jgi:hypothetical protein
MFGTRLVRAALFVGTLIATLWSGIFTTRVDAGGWDAAPTNVTKPISFAILEDYDKGDDLEDIALDFQLMNELEIDVLRCSLGWDDYEPTRGEYDFEWLEQFVALADEYGIKLRPYIAYTPEWAGAPGSDDGIAWNNPPARISDWYNFVYHLASALEDHPNVLSYEIYNEQNTALWWDGTRARYMATLRHGARAIRAADPDAQVLLGGFVFPDDDWLGALTQAGYDRYYQITPFHAYPETWTPPEVTVENYLGSQYHDHFVPTNNELGGGEPIWINELGFATVPGTSEEQQANWWARAMSTFLAEPEIEHLGIYELKDLPEGEPAIGDEPNYHLGLTYPDRTPKLAFYTVDLLTDLLDIGRITAADAEARVTVTGGTARELYHHLFKRPDGSQILFVYDKLGSPTVRITLSAPGSRAYQYALDGSRSRHRAFRGRTLRNVQLTPGSVSIFQIDP